MKKEKVKEVINEEVINENFTETGPVIEEEIITDVPMEQEISQDKEQGFNLIARCDFRDYKKGSVIPSWDVDNVLGSHEINYVVRISTNSEK